MTFKNIIAVLLLLISCSLNAQKIKYKKGIISVDKKEKYEVTKSKNDSGLTSFNFKEKGSKSFLVLKDTLFTYYQLPHEKNPRKAFKAELVIDPQSGKRKVVPIISAFNKRNFVTGKLEKAGFFKSGELDAEIFDAICNIPYEKDYIAMEEKKVERDSFNRIRVGNYELAKAKLGRLISREARNARIDEDKNLIDGNTQIGKYKYNKDASGSYAKGYKFLTKEGHVFANISIISSTQSINVKPIAYEGRKNEFINLKYTKGEKPVTLIEKLSIAFKYLVKAGLI